MEPVHINMEQQATQQQRASIKANTNLRNNTSIMKSKTVERLMNETPEHIKQQEGNNV